MLLGGGLERRWFIEGFDALIFWGEDEQLLPSVEIQLFGFTGSSQSRV